MVPFLLHHAVEQAAARAPQGLALIDGDQRWTYGQLMARSQGLAAGLQALGLRPGGRVGIWMKKSAPAALSLLASLRAGGAYVPLDPFAPAQRIHRLIADCDIEILMADPALPASTEFWAQPPASLRHVIAAPSPPPPPAAKLPWHDWQAMAAHGQPLADRPRVSGDLAYVLYTSGSTGQPKGVMLSHAHALNFIQWAGEEVGVQAADRVASMAPLHFDLSIFDLFASWSRGACVCLLDAVTARFPQATGAWLDAQQISVLYAVPSALIRLLPCCEVSRGGARLEALRSVLFAGEVFPAASLRAWVERLPQARFYNLYGPTETNVCTSYRVPMAAEEIPDPLPIGTVCPNFELQVRDDEGRQVAPNETGFLWVRGAIFLGYWGDAARTAQVRTRAQGEGGVAVEWYNTGDLVHCGADGVLYFEGRRDDLVKCRGYRISLLEIQQTLLRAPRVRAAAVVLAAAGEAEEGLHAYVVADPAGAVAAGELRAWCARTLPAYMIPTLHWVEQLPETPTGKIDRALLHRLAAEGAA